MTTLLPQFHNIGLIGIGSFVCLGLSFGGTAQFIVGLQAIKTGTSFGFSACTAYGCF
jgi:succinate-acetate transporter protein